MAGVAQRTILVADDEPAIVDVFAHYFKNEGFSVVSAGDGPSPSWHSRTNIPISSCSTSIFRI